MNKRWWPVFGAIAGGAIAAAIAWSLAGSDVNQEGDWRGGPARFIGMVTALGLVGGYVLVRQVVGRAPVTRDGFTLSFGRIDPQATDYRSVETITVGDLVNALTKLGYEPRTEACNAVGEPLGSIDDKTPLAGANLAIRDRGVRGWVRVQLSAPIAGQPRSLGVVETWSQRGDSTEELGLFVLRALDGLVGNLTASRESSVLGNDPASLLTAGLAERPVHRRA